MQSAAQNDGEVEEIAHLSLQLGRLLLENGADTAEVQRMVTRFATGLGCDARLIVTYEALMLTLVTDARFRTKIGPHLTGMNVNMNAVDALNRIVDQAVQDHDDLERDLSEKPASAFSHPAPGALKIEELHKRLDAVERGTPAYPRIIVATALGLTAASLSKLFGGDWAVFLIAFVAGTSGTFIRQELGRRRANPFLVPFVAALVSGIIGGLGVRLHPVAAPALCLIAPGMIIVPGVPLINGIWDTIRNHMTLGLSRLGFAGLVVLAIAFGLFVATFVTGVRIPVDGPVPLLPIPEDALFSALAAIGYAFLFNVPVRLCWACVICGVCSHTLRTAAVHFGIDIVTATMLGALAVGFLSQVFAHWFRAPPAAFAFPGVVAMVPGSYAFRAVIGALQIAQAGAGSPAPLIAETTSLIIASLLLTGAIAVGLAAPLVFGKNSARV